ncbi:MAG: phosphoribosyl-ATP diphosphatase [Alphaproteobacteria bacterium]
MNDTDIIDRLYALIDSRKGGDPSSSYVARLHGKGTRKIAEKMGEEAVETVAAAVAGDRSELVAESGDLIFHLMVLWSSTGITPDDVRAELARREGVSGIDEKKSRKS